MNRIKRFTLGQKIRDKVSGMTGIATARLEYLNGCVQYCISPPMDKDGKRVEGWYVDQQTLELVDNGIIGLELTEKANINEPMSPDQVSRIDTPSQYAEAIEHGGSAGGASTREPRT